MKKILLATLIIAAIVAAVILLSPEQDRAKRVIIEMEIRSAIDSSHRNRYLNHPKRCCGDITCPVCGPEPNYTIVL